MSDIINLSNDQEEELNPNNQSENSSENNSSSTEPSSDNESESSRGSNLPRSDFDVLKVAKDVLIKWKESGLVLIYTNPVVFENTVSNYEVKLAEGRSAASERSPKVERIKQLRKIISANLFRIKNYVANDFGQSAASSHYASFGIQHIRKSYDFPSDQEEVKRALAELLNGLDKYGYADFKFGRDFWLPIYEEYTQLIETKNITVGTKSSKSGDKNVLKEQVNKVVHSIYYLLIANYPDTWEQVIRDWGFRRERY